MCMRVDERHSKPDIVQFAASMQLLEIKLQPHMLLPITLENFIETFASAAATPCATFPLTVHVNIIAKLFEATSTPLPAFFWI